MYYEGEGVVQDRGRAAELYQRACEGGDSQACSDLGFSYARGAGVTKDPARARKLYERACDSGVAPGCYNLYEREGVPEDFTLAAEVYEHRCENKDATGCYNLGYMHSEGQVAGPDALDFLRGRSNLAFVQSRAPTQARIVHRKTGHRRRPLGSPATSCFTVA